MAAERKGGGRLDQAFGHLPGAPQIPHDLSGGAGGGGGRRNTPPGGFGHPPLLPQAYNAGFVQTFKNKHRANSGPNTSLQRTPTPAGCGPLNSDR